MPRFWQILDEAGERFITAWRFPTWEWDDWQK